MKNLVIFGLWGDPSSWSIQKYILELPKYLGNERDRARLVTYFDNKEIFNFSSTLALIEGIIAGYKQYPRNPLVKDLKKIWLHIFIPDTLIFNEIRERIMKIRHEELEGKLESDLRELLNIKEQNEEISRSKLAYLVLTVLREIVRNKCNELKDVLDREGYDKSLGLEILEKLLESLGSLSESSLGDSLHPYMHLINKIRSQGVTINISMSLYPVAFSNTFIFFPKNQHNDSDEHERAYRNFVLSIRKGNTDIFEDFMMCSIAVPSMSVIRECMDGDIEGTAIIIDTTHGLNYAMVNYLRALDLSLRLTVIEGVIREFINKEVSRVLRLPIVYYNSDPVPQRRGFKGRPRSANTTLGTKDEQCKYLKSPDVSLKLNVTRVDTVSSQGSVLHILDSLRLLVPGGNLEVIRKSIASRISKSTAKLGERVACLGASLLPAICNAMPLCTYYFSRKLINEMNLVDYLRDRGTNDLLRDLSKAVYNVKYKVKINNNLNNGKYGGKQSNRAKSIKYSLLMDVKLADTFTPSSRDGKTKPSFLPTIYTLTLSYLALTVFRAFDKRKLGFVKKDTKEVICISTSQDLINLFKPIAEYSMLKILENELNTSSDLSYIRKLLEGEAWPSIDERNFFAHAGLILGIINDITIRVYEDDDERKKHEVLLCIRELKHSNRINNIEKYLQRYFAALATES